MAANRRSRKRDKAATLLANAMAGMADIERTKKAFEAAAKEAKGLGAISQAVIAGQEFLPFRSLRSG